MRTVSSVTVSIDYLFIFQSPRMKRENCILTVYLQLYLQIDFHRIIRLPIHNW